MSLFGMLGKAAEVVGGPAVTVAIEGGKALGGLFGGHGTVSGQATMSPEALVQMITGGAGPDGLEGERQDNTAKAQVQNQIEDDTRRHMTTMESAWTGSGADAARDKLQAATAPVAASSQAMATNANTISGQIEAFTTLKNTLHTDVTDNPPQKGLWDTLTPWDTSTEDAINANNAKVQENLQAYNTYAQTAQANAPQLKTDYGQVTDLTGGNFEIQQPSTLPPDKPGQGPNDPGTIGGTGGNGRTGSTNTPIRIGQTGQNSFGSTGQNGTNGQYGTGQNGTGGRTVGSVGQGTGNISGSLDDTQTAGYTSPGGASSYNPSGLGSSSYNPSGSSDFSSGGFGPIGGGFGPLGSAGGLGGSSSSGGYGSGSAGGGAATGSGALTGGKATGGVAAEAGAAGAAAKAGAAGASGRSGMGGMGGAHGGKGGEDSEHQRPSYLIEEDPDGLFGTDEKTAPPVIGL